MKKLRVQFSDPMQTPRNNLWHKSQLNVLNLLLLCIFSGATHTLPMLDNTTGAQFTRTGYTLLHMTAYHIGSLSYKW